MKLFYRSLYVLMFLILVTAGCHHNIIEIAADGKGPAAGSNLTFLGENVFLFGPEMEMSEIQTVIDSIFARQATRKSEFTKDRYALLFRPGKYRLDVRVGYYTQVMGLGVSPVDVVIEGAVRSNSINGHMLTNFWRSAENITIIPPAGSANIWGVSQATPLRRVWVQGDLRLYDTGYSSGGFIADCRIDGVVSSGTQQQWFTRNTALGSWQGGNWNMMFVGVENAPAEEWPAKPYTTIMETPEIREKPYLILKGTSLKLTVPGLKKNSRGYSWHKPDRKNRKLRINDFYIARPGTANATTINSALKRGKHILFTPGVYSLGESLKVTSPGTVLYGLGMAALLPVNGNSAIEISDVEGVTVAGLLIDAGPEPSVSLMEVGERGSDRDHGNNPTYLHDIFFRVGGPHEGSASACLVINSNNVCADHVWLWRADHGTGVGWNQNRGANGLIVNGDDVTFYGLFNEHFQEYQTVWNGEGGRVYFYQSEMPYDPPSADDWRHGQTYGYASYKVADHVKDHQAWGVGIYNVFWNAPVIVDQAIETPEHLEQHVHHKIIYWLNGHENSVVRSIINGKGEAVSIENRKATMK